MGANLQVGPHARCVDLRPCAAGCGGAGRWLAARGAAAARRRASCAAEGSHTHLAAGGRVCPPLPPPAPLPHRHCSTHSCLCSAPSPSQPIIPPPFKIYPPLPLTFPATASCHWYLVHCHCACRSFRGDAVARAKLNVGPIL